MASTARRLIVSFEPRNWEAIRKRLRDGGARHIAHIDDFKRRPHEAHREPALAVSDLGVVMIDPARTGTDAAALAKIKGVVVRPEAMLTRAPVKIADASRPTRLDWLAEATQTWALSALGVDARDSDGGAIQIGVIDSGIARHPDLDAQVVDRISVVPGNDGLDRLGHGTHSTGLVCGARVPKSGPRYGVAPSATVLGVRVFGGDGDTTGEGMVRTGIYLAVKRGCRVLCLAAGRIAPTYTQDDEYLGRFLVAENCILMAAAGNDSDRGAGVTRPTRAPANAPFVPAIGAMTATIQVWNDSNGIGDDPATRVDALAPGTNVRSAWMGGGTVAVSGTSAATALAAGVAAAVWSRDRTLSASDVIRNLSRTARRVPGAPTGSAGDGYLQVR
jgi:subtilisin family serine protease